MKSVHEIKQRIQELQRAQNNGVDVQLQLEILRSATYLSEKQMKLVLKNQIEQEQYKTARISLWILDNSINKGW